MKLQIFDKDKPSFLWQWHILNDTIVNNPKLQTTNKE